MLRAPDVGGLKASVNSFLRTTVLLGFDLFCKICKIFFVPAGLYIRKEIRWKQSFKQVVCTQIVCCSFSCQP